MPNEENEEEFGRFGLGIRAFKISDDGFRFKFESVNVNVPIEAVVMQLEAFLRNIKSGYFDGFDKEYE